MDEVTEGITNVGLDKVNVLCVKTAEEDLQVQAIWDIIEKKKHNEIVQDYIQRIHQAYKPCDLKFSSESDLEEHKRVHTTCIKCKTDMKTKYKYWYWGLC